MTTVRTVTMLCDKCKADGVPEEERILRPTVRYVIIEEGIPGKKKARHRTLDLCDPCGEPLQVMLGLREPRGYPHVKTARQRNLPKQSAPKQGGARRG